jgi:hypothetical protein
MMRRAALMTALLATLLMARPVPAQNYSGTYALQTSEGTNTMILRQDASGNVEGEITMEGGEKATLKGNLQGNQVLGITTMTQGSTLFKITSQGQQVTFTLIPVTADNKPDLAHAQEIPFTRQGDAAAGGSANRNQFSGAFSDGKVFLELEGGGGRYDGQLEFQGKSFPVTAQSADGRSLEGTFQSGSDSFDFTGRLEGATLTFVTGGTTYHLRSQNAESVGAGNSLTGGSAATGYENPGGASAGYNPVVAGEADGIQRDPKAPATPGRFSDNNPQSLEWLNHLRGKLLTQMSSYSSGSAGGYSSNRRMLLYSNGQFEYYSSSSVSVDVDGASGGSGGQNTQRGTWRIVTAEGKSYLALVFQGTAKEDYVELVFRDNKTFIDGTRTFVTNPQ